MDRLLRLSGAGLGGMGGAQQPADAPVVDTAEQVEQANLSSPCPHPVLTLSSPCPHLTSPVQDRLSSPCPSLSFPALTCPHLSPFLITFHLSPLACPSIGVMA